MSRRAAAVACFALLAAGCAPDTAVQVADPVSADGCDPATTAAVASGFYREIVARNPRGLPSSSDMRALAPLLSSDLQTAIEAARVRQRAAMEARPDEKPPFVEGSLFTSLFEGPTSVVSAEADAGTPARVAVTLQYDGGGSSTWTDHLQLRCEDARWRVDDVAFGGDWAFASQGSLRAALDAE